ncbi:MAG TPA: hypothetical protein VD962_08490 [Rubricoccaceae bacterium]|nr:hypothetical protein [Rubricoccaceae bacterium]
MPERPSAPDDAFWADLARRPWRRVKWRRTVASPAATCLVYGTPIHRVGTYYLRPAYTDGAVWLSQRAYDEMVRRTKGPRASRRYGPPREE